MFYCMSSPPPLEPFDAPSDTTHDSLPVTRPYSAILEAALKAAAAMRALEITRPNIIDSDLTTVADGPTLLRTVEPVVDNNNHVGSFLFLLFFCVCLVHKYFLV